MAGTLQKTRLGGEISVGLVHQSAGRQVQVIILEQVGDGGRVSAVLKPGETLRLGEQVLSKFIAGLWIYAMRVPFPYRDNSLHATGMGVAARIRYRVTDARRGNGSDRSPGRIAGQSHRHAQPQLIRYSEVEVTRSD